MRKIYLLVITIMAVSLSYSQYVTTNGGSGLNATYPDLNTAITALNGAFIYTPVVITLNANETAPAGGYVITATGNAASPITIQGSNSSITVTANAALTPGNLNDAIFSIQGGAYITIQSLTMQENPSNTNTTVASNNMTEWGVAVLYATTTQGSKNITIQNNTISLNRTYTNTFGIYSNVCHAAATPTTNVDITSAAGDNSNLHIYGNTISNINCGIAVIGAPAFVGSGLDIGGTSSATGNTIYNFGTSNANMSAFPRIYLEVYGILAVDESGVNIQYNNIGSSNPVFYNNTTAGSLAGIYLTANGSGGTSTSPVYSASANTSTISNNSIAIQLAVNNVASTNFAIHNDFGNSFTSVVINNNNIHNILDSGALVTTPKCNFWLIDNAASCLNQTFSNNTFTDLSVNTYGYLRLINNSGILQGGTQTISNNATATALSNPPYYLQIGYSAGGATNTTVLINEPAVHLAGSTVIIQNNNFSKINNTRNASLYGMQITSGAGNNITKTISNNTISNVSSTLSSSIGIYAGSGTSSYPVSVYNNSVSNFTNSVTSYGIYFSGPYGSVYSNTVSNLNSTTGVVYGIYCPTNANPSALNIYQNNINALNSSTGGSVFGMYLYQSNNLTVYKNKISDLTSPYASANRTSIVAGIKDTLIATGSTPAWLFYDNLIGNLSAAASTNYNAVNGFIVSGTGATVQLYHNTVYIGNTSGGATFGTSCVTFDNSTIASLDLRNNILINLATPGSSAGIVAGLRAYSAGTSGTVPSKYYNASNNNVFYINPSAGIANHLTYVEGGIGSGAGAATMSATANPENTLANFKTFTSIGTGGHSQDAASVEDNISFLSTAFSSTAFLQPALEGYYTGATGTGVSSDYLGVTRNSTPDIGAYESTAKVWNGASSTNWTDAGNWRGSNVPATTDSAIIMSGAANYPALTGSVTIAGIGLQPTSTINLGANNISVSGSFSNNGTISGTGSVILNGISTQLISGAAGFVSNLTLSNASGATITGGMQSITGILNPISGTLNTGGNLTLKSSAAATASVAAGSGNYINGLVTVERYVPAHASKTYTLVSSPVNSPTIYAGWQENGAATSGYGTQITGAVSGNGFDAASAAGIASIYNYNDANASGSKWLGLTNTNTNTLNAGTGYLVFIRGDRTVAPGGTGASGATTLRASGNLTTGTVTFATSGGTTGTPPLLAASGTYNLVANPFPSAINWSKLTLTNLDANFTVYDPNLGSFVTSNGTVVAPNTGQQQATYLQSGQPFFIHSNSAAPQLTIPESAKVTTAPTGSSATVFGIALPAGQLNINVYNTTAGTNVFADGTVAIFNDKYSNELGIEDAIKFTNFNEMVSLVRENTNLSIEGRTLPADNDTLFVNFQQMKTGVAYNIVIDGTGFNSSNGIEASLVDNANGSSNSININGKTTYAFTNTAASGSRFMIVLKNTNKASVMADNSVINSLVTYPNPVTDQLRVTNNTVMHSIRLIDLQGHQVLMQSGINTNQAVLDVSSMSAGIYIVEVTDVNGNTSTKKIVK